MLALSEILSKLDRVHTFTIIVVLADGSKDACPTANGSLAFYTDAQDARAALAEVEALHETKGAKTTLRIDVVPLGRAFAITQGLMGLKTPLPAKLVFSKAVVGVEGDAGVPAALRPRMEGTGPFPLFMSCGLETKSFTPVFLSREDLAEAWLRHGKPLEELSPSVLVTDLRTLVARTLKEVAEWRSLVFVQPRAHNELARAILAQGEQERTLASGLVKGEQLLKQVRQRVAVEDGDEPPPLV